MPIENTIPDTLPLEDPEDGVFTCYANQVNISWTAFDVALQLGEFYDDIQEYPIKHNYRIEKHARVTMSWVQAKQLSELLGRVISGYEKENGKIQSVEDFKSFNA